LRKQLLEENKDGKSETNLAKCRKCRLDKCLSVGMKRLGLLKLELKPFKLPSSLSVFFQ